MDGRLPKNGSLRFVVADASWINHWKTTSFQLSYYFAEITFVEYRLGHSLDINVVSRIDVDILPVRVSNPFGTHYPASELPKFLAEPVNMIREVLV
jgi:hypothetical protein